VGEMTKKNTTIFIRLVHNKFDTFYPQKICL
jgi:hypothetical protein